MEHTFFTIGCLVFVLGIAFMLFSGFLCYNTGFFSKAGFILAMVFIFSGIGIGFVANKNIGNSQFFIEESNTQESEYSIYPQDNDTEYLFVR